MKIALIILGIFLSKFSYSDSINEKRISSLNFKVDINSLKDADLFYSMEVLTNEEFKELDSPFRNLDSINLRNMSGVRLVLTKSVFIVDKPLSFFSKERLLDEKFNEKTMSDTKVRKIDQDSFNVYVNDIFNYSYVLNVRYLSTTEIPFLSTTSKASLDNILEFETFEGKNIIALRESIEFDALAKGTVFATRHVSRKDGKTVLVSYGILAIKKIYVLPGVLESNLKKSILGFKKGFSSI